MPFLPHTESDVQAMLKAIGVDSIEQLFDEIPPQLIVKPPGARAGDGRTRWKWRG